MMKDGLQEEAAAGRGDLCRGEGVAAEQPPLGWGELGGPCLGDAAPPLLCLTVGAVWGGLRGGSRRGFPCLGRWCS
jgi:hypothetical protein